VLALVLVVCISAASAAEKDPAAIKHNRLQIDPSSLIVGGLYGYYEFRPIFHHALAVDGGYSFPLLGTRAWQAGANYRYYYNRTSFVGLVANRAYQFMKLPSTERGDTAKYPLEVSWLNVGANWGKTWHLFKRFPLTFRVGAGYPVDYELAWKEERHPWARIYETMYRFTACLDSELSFGVSF
jgi:hypothetical protein